MTDIQTQLEHSSFFKGISRSAKEALSKVCILKQYSKRDFLFHEDAKGEGLYLLINGSVQLHKTTTEGKEIVIKIAKPGEVFAEVILFEKNRYPVTAVAVIQSEVIFIPKIEIFHLLEQTDFRNEFIAMLMKKQRYLAERIAYLSSYDIEERFRMFLREHFSAAPQIECNISKKDIALAIGATPESLSRLLLTLKERQELTWEGKKICVSPNFWKDEE